MKVLPSSSIPTRTGNPAYFTGTVHQEVLAEDPALPFATFRVTFSPGARTHWHTHPGGQVLLVTSGHGFVQKEGEAIQPLAAGDTVVILPGELHWHGAAPDGPFQHIATQPVKDGAGAAWFAPVTEEEYNAR